MNDMEGGKVVLKRLRKGDATQEYVRWMNDPEVNRYLESRHAKFAFEDCERFVEDRLKDSWLFGIFAKNDARHVGNIKLGSINKMYHRADVGYLIGDKGSWGKGFATEAVRLVTQFGLEQLSLHRIEAGCYADNLGSLRVLMKCGYSVEGYMRDYCVLDGEWQDCFKLAIVAERSKPENA